MTKADRIAIVVCIIGLLGLHLFQSAEIDKYRQEIQQMRRQIIETQAEIRAWLDKLGVMPETTVSYYAPLDPKATICHNGDPTHTATGTYPTAGRTIAVDPSVIPLGSRVYIEGIGWRVAEDKGGKIKNNKIDLCMNTAKECYEWGIRTATVIYLK